MSKAYLDEIKEGFEDFALDSGLSNINRLKAGFVSDVNYVKGIISTITLHALSNSIIFNKEQIENLIGICNILRHG